MAKYNTIQREQLVRFLTANKTTAMTVLDIAKSMKQAAGELRCPSESTIYRLVSQLVEEGAVKRMVNGHSREFLYQIVDDEGCRKHLHMKCGVCGRMLHMTDETSEQLVALLLENEGFHLDRSIVLQGTCRDCGALPNEKNGKTQGEQG